jgi:hypothetical protein
MRPRGPAEARGRDGPRLLPRAAAVEWLAARRLPAAIALLLLLLLLLLRRRRRLSMLQRQPAAVFVQLLGQLLHGVTPSCRHGV